PAHRHSTFLPARDLFFEAARVQPQREHRDPGQSQGDDQLLSHRPSRATKKGLAPGWYPPASSNATDPLVHNAERGAANELRLDVKLRAAAVDAVLAQRVEVACSAVQVGELVGRTGDVEAGAADEPAQKAGGGMKIVRELL